MCDYPKVYISGPISLGDVAANVRRATDAAEKLMKAGFAVLCPQLTTYIPNHLEFSLDEWMKNDLPWVAASDVILRLPGKSSGADIECEHAMDLGMSLYTDIDMLIRDRKLFVKEEEPEGVSEVSVAPLNYCFDAILEEIRALHAKKGQDYGTDKDPLANIRASEQFGIPPWLGAIIRANDKVSRIQTFARRGTLQNESVEDSLRDLAVYAVIALQLYREETS